MRGRFEPHFTASVCFASSGFAALVVSRATQKQWMDGDETLWSGEESSKFRLKGKEM